MTKLSTMQVNKVSSIDGQVMSGMCTRVVAWLLLAVCLATTATGKDAEVIASFETPDSALNWVSVNDGVMGGVSKGGLVRTERKTLLFAGNLSLENNGGFASIRTKPSTMKLDGATGIIVKARGDGRTYWVGLRTTRQLGSSSYRAYLLTSKGKFRETLIPLSDFKLQAFGRQLPGGAIDPAAIASVGFTLADKKAGPFELEIESIKAVFEDAKPPATEPGGTIVDVAAAAGTFKTLTPVALIGLAIDRGVPLFNSGTTEGCAAVYEVTCEALRIMPDVSADSRKEFAQALAKMRAEKTASEKAWILRRALDRFLSRGE